MAHSTISHEIRLKVLKLNHISGFEFFHRHTRIRNHIIFVVPEEVQRYLSRTLVFVEF